MRELYFIDIDPLTGFNAGKILALEANSLPDSFDPTYELLGLQAPESEYNIDYIKGVRRGWYDGFLELERKKGISLAHFGLTSFPDIMNSMLFRYVMNGIKLDAPDVKMPEGTDIKPLANTLTIITYKRFFTTSIAYHFGIVLDEGEVPRDTTSYRHCHLFVICVFALYFMRFKSLFLPSLRSISAASAGVFPLSC